MRNFDLRNVYFDADGNRFVGKIYFTERDSSSGQTMPNLKPIYASDGETQLANPIYSTASGVTSSQVFLAAGAYSVWLYKYVGNGVMSEDTDDEHWERVNFTPFNVEDVTEEIGLHISSKALLQVANIDELESTGAADVPLTSDERRLVMLMGYNYAGDKRPVIYSLVSTSRASDGGSVIDSADAGYKWILVDDGETYVDVADFGVFPNLGDSTNVSQISAAVTYANTKSKDLHFNSGDYKFNGSSYSLNKNIILDNATFTFKANTTTSISCKKLNAKNSSLFYLESEANATITADDIWLSWKHSGSLGVNLIARKNFNVDTNYAFAVSDADVWLNTSHSAGGTFTRCNIHGYGKLNGNYSFTKCKFTDRYYSSPSTLGTQFSVTDCDVDINEFERVDNWFNACRKMGVTSFDFQGKGFESDVTLNFAANVRNGEFNHKITCTSNATFRDCQFANFACYGQYIFIFDNCTLTISANVYTKNLTMRNCVVNGSNYGIIGRETTYLNGCHIGCKIGWEDEQETYAVDAIDAHDTQFSKEVRVTYNEFYSCDFLAPLYVYSTRLDGTESTSCRIIGCIFRESAYQYYANGTSTPCNCVWKNNQFFCYNAANAIQFSYPPKSDECYYEYEGNTGSCLKEKGIFDATNSISATWELEGSGTDSRYLNCNAYLPGFNAFALGDKEVKITLTIECASGEFDGNFVASYTHYSSSDEAKGKYTWPSYAYKFLVATIKTWVLPTINIRKASLEYEVLK